METRNYIGFLFNVIFLLGLGSCGEGDRKVAMYIPSLKDECKNVEYLYAKLKDTLFKVPLKYRVIFSFDYRLSLGEGEDVCFQDPNNPLLLVRRLVVQNDGYNETDFVGDAIYEKTRGRFFEVNVPNEIMAKKNSDYYERAQKGFTKFGIDYHSYPLENDFYVVLFPGPRAEGAGRWSYVSARQDANTPNGYPLTYNCGGREFITLDGMNVGRSCNTAYDWHHGLIIRYRFRTKLPPNLDWHEADKTIREALKSWEVKESA